MPRIARRPVAPRRHLTALQVWQMCSGTYFFSRDPDRLTEADLADLWPQWRASLLPLHVGAYPGSRPYAWWLCDSPEDRDEAEAQWEYLARLRLWLPGEAARCRTPDCWHQTYEKPYGPCVDLGEVREWMGSWQGL